jgi:hypothetical protein
MSTFKKLWKNYLLSNPDLDVSNKHLRRIKDLSSPQYQFETLFEEIAKNKGISFIFLDPTESFIQLFHHCHIIGGSWANPSKTFVGILGTDKNAKPIQIILKSVKLIKTKTVSMAELIGDERSTNNQETKQTKSEFHFCNILPIPHVLTKAYLELDTFDPQTVALAFYSAMSEFDQKETDTQPNQDTEIVPPLQDERETDNTRLLGNSDEQSTSSNHQLEVGSKGAFLSEFVHILQFCHLCYKKKIPPISYSVETTQDIEQWFTSIFFSALHSSMVRSKRQVQSNDDVSDSDDKISSPEQRLSKRDHFFPSAMMKINDAMDKNYKDKSEKELGFNRLEEHRKNLILNASAIPPFDEQAPQPTELYTAFLAKKNQFKAKDMLLHRLQSEKICFNPGSSFINNLWNCDFFWLLPDTPSGVSIFFCSETKSANAADIEKDCLLALADKVNLTDIEKLAKQKLYIPNTLMDMVWMTQNFYTIIKLCFGPKVHSATFLKDWADHMCGNRNMYLTQHSADPFFFAKVLCD